MILIGKKSLTKISLMLILLFIFFILPYIAKSDVSGPQLRVENSMLEGNLWSKKVIVYNNENKHYYNVSVSTDIPENLIDVELYRYITSNLKMEVTNNPAYSFQIIDSDDNELTDTVKWIVPELSEVSFSVEGKLTSDINTLKKLKEQESDKNKIQLTAEIGKPVIWRVKLEAINEEIAKSLIPKDATNTITREIATKDIKTANIKAYEIEYETPAPYKEELLIKPFISGEKYTKRVIVKSNFSEHYKNVKAYIDIPEELSQEKYKIRLYHIIDGSKIEVTNNQKYSVLFIDFDNNGFIDKLEWIVPQLSEQEFEVEADLIVIDVQSYPTVWGNWTVRFNTTGTADLTITAVDETEFGKDLEFLELRCGDTILDAEYNETFAIYRNYHCDDIGYETSKVLMSGKHTLEFKFGNDIDYAYNQAGWWDQSWQYRKEMNISNTYDNITEYQILLYADTSTLISQGKMNSDCSDIRFTNSTGRLIPYYIDENPGFDCNDSDTLIWVQTDILTNNTNTTFYMYYGNSGASSLSDMTDVFNYSAPKTIYYTTGENVYDGTIQVAAYRDNTNVTATGKSVILNAGGTTTFTTAQYGGTGASYLNVTSPIIGGDSLTTVGAEINPISWASKEFVIANKRGAFDLYFYSPFASITINCYNATTTANTWGIIRDTASCNKGAACAATTYAWLTGQSIYCNSTAPFLMFIENVADSNFPVYPMSQDRWIISDSVTANAKNNVAIQELGSDATNTTGTRNISYQIVKTDGSQGNGLAWHIIANQTAIGAGATADGDGSEDAAYSPEFELEKEYYLYKNGSYVAIAATRVNTNCTLYTGGGYTNISDMSSGSNDYPWPSKVDIGTGASTLIYMNGAKVVCNATWGGHWEAGLLDESTLFGMKAGRQYVYPEPTYVIGSEEAVDLTSPTYSLNSTNSTTVGSLVLHSLNWTDDVTLSGYVFSFDNCTGSLTNDTWASFSGGTWSNVTKTINSTSSCTIRWCIYANDTSNNWNGTSCQNPFSYTTTSGAACSVAIGLSNALADGIVFSSVSQGQTKDALGNNGELATDYYVTVQISGCSPSYVDVYMKANNFTNGSYSIDVSNEKFRNSTTGTVPPTLTNVSLSANWILVGDNLADSEKIYLKYLLSVPSTQKAGNYNNTVNIWGGRNDLIPT